MLLLHAASERDGMHACMRTARSWQSWGLHREVFCAVQAARLDGFHCAAAEARHAYKHKHMKTAFSQVPLPKDAGAAMSSKARLRFVAHAVHPFMHAVSCAG
jgi:hypothetical protein